MIRYVLFISALGGWYVTKSLKGAAITFAIGMIVILLIKTLQSVRFNKRMKSSGIVDIDQMTGSRFEEYIGVLFSSQGYGVKHTSATGDYGADLILKKGQDLIVVQAKRYTNSVGIAAVQEVIPAVKMYNANAAWVVSNSYYTKAAMTLAKSNHVRMINRDELIRMSIELKDNRNEKEVNESIQSVEASREPIGKSSAMSFGFYDEIPKTATAQMDSISSSTNKLEPILKEFRLKISRQSGMKAFHIFTNKTLDELVEKKPLTIEELRKIRGIGEKKIEGFGEELIYIIKSSQDSQKY